MLVAVVLLIALTIATVTDFKSQRIPNWLTFPLILAGLAAHTVYGGLHGLQFSAAGFALGLGVMLIPYFMGLMGAGDVKLMAGVGAWLGVKTAFAAFLFTCFAGGVYSLIVMLRHMDFFKAVLGNIYYSFRVFLYTRKIDYAPTAPVRTLPRLCYGVAIAVGTVASMALSLHDSGVVFLR